MSLRGTLETPGTCHQGALYDRCRLNSGRKGYDGGKVANRLTPVVPYRHPETFSRPHVIPAITFYPCDLAVHRGRLGCGGSLGEEVHEGATSAKAGAQRSNPQSKDHGSRYHGSSTPRSLAPLPYLHQG